MQPTDREFTLAAAATAAGLTPANLSAWHKRHGLFPEIKKARAWTRYSLFEICALRLGAQLVALGMPLPRAIEYINHMGGTLILSLLCANEPVLRGFLLMTNAAGAHTLFTFTSGAETIREAMALEISPVVLIDLQMVINECLVILGLEKVVVDDDATV